MRILPPFEERIRHSIRDELAKKPTITMTAAQEQLEKEYGRDFHFSYLRKLVGKVDPTGRWFMTGHTSEEDRRVSMKTIPVAELEHGWEGPSASLAGPIARAIGIGHIVSKEWMASMMARSR